MSNIQNLNHSEGISKLKKLVESITTCFFCTDLKNSNGSTSTVMTAQEVDEQGNIWFFSGLDSERNQTIASNNTVQLFFSDPSKNFYLETTGEATVVGDKAKMKELWNPLLKIWFKDGVEDSNISLIKVSPINAHYWDSDGGQMVNFFKMVASAITGNNYVDGQEGHISL